MSIVSMKNENWEIELDSNDGTEICTDIRPYIVINTIALADNIAQEFLNSVYVKETHIYDIINETLDDCMELVFDDVITILENNNIEVL